VSSGEIRSGKLAGRSMRSAIWILALPILIQQTMAACVGLVDTIFAGHLPPAMVVSALDAIGIGSYVTWFVVIAMTGLGAGGQAIIARAMGAGDHAESHLALGHAVVLSLAWGVVVGLVMWVGASPLADLCRLGSDAADMLVVYVRIIAYAMPAAALMMVGAMCLYGAGETVMPSVIAVGVNIVNIAVSWALSGVDLTVGSWTLVNPFGFDLHLAGIAWGTSCSFVSGAVATLWVLKRGVKDLRLERRDLRIQRPMTLRIVRVGLPGFADSIMMWVANLLVLVVIGMVAAAEAIDGVPKEGLQGAHLIAIRWESFSFLPGFAVGTAAGALAGQYLGAGNTAMARKSILTCTGIGIVLMGALGLVFILGGTGLTRIISDQPVHLAETPELLAICGVVQVFFAVTMVLRQGLRGVGDTRWTFLITTFASWGLRLPAAWLFGVYMGMGLRGIWLGLCGEIVLRAVLFAWRFQHGGWMRIRV
jgi:putative MATE family efflux protein